jgi:MFS family permease
VYPTLIAAMSDAVSPAARAPVVGVYRFWRDFGFVLGALIAGSVADATSPQTAIALVAALTAASGLIVAATGWQPRPAALSRRRRIDEEAAPDAVGTLCRPPLPGRGYAHALRQRDRARRRL